MKQKTITLGANGKAAARNGVGVIATAPMRPPYKVDQVVRVRGTLKKMKVLSCEPFQFVSDGTWAWIINLEPHNP